MALSTGLGWAESARTQHLKPRLIQNLRIGKNGGLLIKSDRPETARVAYIKYYALP